MFSCNLNYYQGDFGHDSVMFSENNHFCTLGLNQQYKYTEFSNMETPQSFNTNMLEQSCKVSNISKCIAMHNTDQENFSYGEFYKNKPTRKYRMNNIPYVTSNLQIPLSYTRKTSVKSSLKQKRRRTNFTTEQIIALEEVFKTKPYVHYEERIEMMKKLNINERSIKIWFQNRRRLSEKKTDAYNLDSPLSENSSETICDRINLIEAYIRQNSDDRGYVTLDGEIMSNLMDILDECLPRDIYFEKTSEDTVTYDNKTMYEPISPVNLSENSETPDEGDIFENRDLLLGITDYYYL